MLAVFANVIGGTNMRTQRGVGLEYDGDSSQDYFLAEL